MKNQMRMKKPTIIVRIRRKVQGIPRSSSRKKKTKSTVE
jgi:hypothetical protein